jgi:hypothetical protein
MATQTAGQRAPGDRSDKAVDKTVEIRFSSKRRAGNWRRDADGQR